ncbi:hypothetical protein GCM10010289_59560 [Streptomyces violascens]|nr:hypothetical protein GCM10010289_59560 [Streptomyces violascens]
MHQRPGTGQALSPFAVRSRPWGPSPETGGRGHAPALPWRAGVEGLGGDLRDLRLKGQTIERVRLYERQQLDTGLWMYHIGVPLWQTAVNEMNCIGCNSSYSPTSNLPADQRPCIGNALGLLR